MRRLTSTLVAGAVLSIAVTTGAIEAAAARDVDTRPRTAVPGFLLDHGQYVKFDAPDAGLETGPNSINNRGQVVGAYIDDDADATYHGFLRDRRGRFTTMDIPGARATVASRINDRGQIVGRYYEATPFRGPESRSRGFLLDDGRLTRIEVPGARQTQAVGVNNRGQVVGEYVDGSGTFHGYVWEKGQFTTVDFPGAEATSLIDINDRGDVLGAYLDKDGQFVGFVWRDGRYTTINAPDAPFVFPRDINNRGQIVGFTFLDPSLAGARGFLLAKGAKGPVTPIEVPGAPLNSANGLNDRAQIVGQYQNTSALTPEFDIDKRRFSRLGVG